jgi:hypothetical protein
MKKLLVAIFLGIGSLLPVALPFPSTATTQPVAQNSRVKALVVHHGEIDGCSLNR